MAAASTAPQLSLSVETREIQAAFRRLAEVTGKKLGVVVKQNARLIAWNLAHNTQPYGMDLATKKMGEAAVLRDVGRVYSAASAIFKKLQDTGQVKVAKEWYKLVKIGGYGKAEKLLKSTSLQERNTPIFAPLDPSLHDQARNSRGRVVRHRPAQILPDAKDLRNYGAKRKALVGFGKAGWITAGASLGSITRVPAWITRHKGIAPGRANDQSNRTYDPFVTFTNAVRYASSILPEGQIAAALKIQREKMLAHIEHVLVNSGREAGFQSSSNAPSQPLPMAA
ncbi:hypothetical protein [Prosthecobacter sp.]|uniref:hypothetical protein n=1 Tax=Prosthecobacter sp. TaxID=1965333 RepID=UPI00378457DD